MRTATMSAESPSFRNLFGEEVLCPEPTTPEAFLFIHAN